MPLDKHAKVKQVISTLGNLVGGLNEKTELRSVLERIGLDVPEDASLEEMIIILSNSDLVGENGNDYSSIIARLQAIAGGINEKAELISILNEKGISTSDSDSFEDLLLKVKSIIKSTGDATEDDVLKNKIFSNKDGNNLIGKATIESIIEKDGNLQNFSGTVTATISNFLKSTANYRDDGDDETEIAYSGNMIIPYPLNSILLSIYYTFYFNSINYINMIFKNGIFRLYGTKGTGRVTGDLGPRDVTSEQFNNDPMYSRHNDIYVTKYGNSNSFFKDNHLEVPFVFANTSIPLTSDSTFSISYIASGIKTQ